MKMRLAIFGFLLSVLLSSCDVYHPIIADIPLISKKHELRVDAGASMAPTANTTISYGLTDKFAIQVYANTDGYERYFIQGSFGCYKNLGNNNIMELYTGLGHGYGDAYRDANPGDLLGDYQTYSVQLNYGKVNGKFAHIDYGFGVKAGLLHSNLTDQNYYQRIYPETGQYLTYHDNSLLFEPVGFVRIGGEKLKVSFKLGGCWMYKFTNTGKYLPYSHINFGIGLNYIF